MAKNKKIIIKVIFMSIVLTSILVFAAFKLGEKREYERKEAFNNYEALMVLSARNYIELEYENLPEKTNKILVVSYASLINSGYMDKIYDPKTNKECTDSEILIIQDVDGTYDFTANLVCENYKSLEVQPKEEGVAVEEELIAEPKEEEPEPTTPSDNTNPIIEINGSSSVTIEVKSTYLDKGATASDNVDGNITSKIVTTSTVNENAVGTYKVKYNVADNAGNKASEVTRTVNVVDTTKPVVTLNGSEIIVMNLNAAYTELGAAVTDNYDSNLIVTINTSALDITTIGDYIITYSATDLSGNKSATITRTIRVVDTTKPVITLTGVNPQIIEVETAYSELSATATDNYDGTITNDIVIDATNVNTNTVGSYTVTYNVDDASGNSATEVTRTVNVIDITKPVITLTGANPQIIEVGVAYSELNATATDNYDGTITNDIVIDATNVNTNTVGSYTVTYNVTDANSNGAIEVTRTVNIVDTTIPIITLTGVNPQIIEVGNSYSELNATATDNYDGTITNDIVIDATNVNTNTVGSYTVTYNVTDANSNEAVEVTRTVNIVDTTIPGINLLGDNPLELYIGDSYTEPGALATDNYDNGVLLTANIAIDSSSVNTSAVGSYSVTYNVSDSSGNAAIEVTRTVNVLIPPVQFAATNPADGATVTSEPTFKIEYLTENVKSIILTVGSRDYYVFGTDSGTGSNRVMRTCKEILVANPAAADGVYYVYFDGAINDVHCDMVNGGRMLWIYYGAATSPYDAALKHHHINSISMATSNGLSTGSTCSSYNVADGTGYWEQLGVSCHINDLGSYINPSMTLSGMPGLEGLRVTYRQRNGFGLYINGTRTDTRGGGNTGATYTYTGTISAGVTSIKGVTDRYISTYTTFRDVWVWESDNNLVLGTLDADTDTISYKFINIVSGESTYKARVIFTDNSEYETETRTITKQ